MIRRIVPLLAVVCCATLAIADAATLEELRTRVQTLHETYDMKDAETALTEVEAFIARDPSPEAQLLLARAALQVAMLRREIYEKDELDLPAKRDLGTAIDAVAGTGQLALKSAPEVSERYRIEADLWGTIMRTQWKGNKFKDQMGEALAKAEELDPDNPMVYVSQSKRYIFARERQGGDLEKAVETLNKALALDPDNVPAYLFRGLAHEKLEDLPAARADWQRALEINPRCRPAREFLERTK